MEDAILIRVGVSVELVSAAQHVMLIVQVVRRGRVIFVGTVYKRPQPAHVIKTPLRDSGPEPHAPHAAQTGGEQGAESSVTLSTDPNVQAMGSAPCQLPAAASDPARLASGQVLTVLSV